MDNMFLDWKFYAFVIQGFLTIGGIALLKFNDFRHLTKDVKENTKKLDSLDNKFDNVNIKVAVLEEKVKAI